MKTIYLACLLVCVGITSPGVTLNQLDTFDSGLLENWNGASPDITTGGPDGATDNFLIFTAHGGGGSNSKMIGYNVAQWSGNYSAAGVARLTFHAKNLSSQTLQLRAVLKTGFGNTPGFASTTSYSLPTDGAWHRVVLDLNEAAMTRVNSSSLVFSNLIENVGELRILHAAAPSIIGDPLVGSYGLDNIQGLSATGPQLEITAFTNMVQVSWLAAGAAGFRLESSSNLTSGAAWTLESEPVNSTGTNFVVILPALSASQIFYRLNLP
jgi:hypothetical protein